MWKKNVSRRNEDKYSLHCIYFHVPRGWYCFIEHWKIQEDLFPHVLISSGCYDNLPQTSAWKQMKLNLPSFWRPEIRITGMKEKRLQGHFLSGNRSGEFISCFFHLSMAVSILWLMAASLQSFAPSAHQLFHYVCIKSPFVFFSWGCMWLYSGPTQIVQGNLPMPGSFT